MLYGREFRLPADMQIGPLSWGGFQTGFPNTHDLRKRQRRTHNVTREKFRLQFRRQKDYYDKSQHGPPRVVGNKAFYRDTLSPVTFQNSIDPGQGLNEIV